MGNNSHNSSNVISDSSFLITKSLKIPIYLFRISAAKLIKSNSETGEIYLLFLLNEKYRNLSLCLDCGIFEDCFKVFTVCFEHRI